MEADRQLERTSAGYFWLRQPQVAECVSETIREGAQVRSLYELVAFVVMPNHVHLLINPGATAPKITQFVKGVSAKRANELLRRTGHRFWQDESFDHWVRSPKERDSIIRYIDERISHPRLTYFGIRALSQASQTKVCATSNIKLSKRH